MAQAHGRRQWTGRTGGPSPRSRWPAERGQRRDAAQAPQPGHYQGVGTVAAICVIAASRGSLAIQGGQHGVERGLIGQLQARRGEGVQPQPQFVLAGPCLPAGVDDPLPQQQFERRCRAGRPGLLRHRRRPGSDRTHSRASW